MKKKRIKWRLTINRKARKLLMIMKLTVVLVFALVLGLSAKSFPQKKVNIPKGTITYENLFKELTKQTGYYIVYSNNSIDKDELVKVDFVNKSLEEVLIQVLNGKELVFLFKDEFIIIKPDKKKKATEPKNIIKGKVIDEKCNPLPGVTVVLQGTTIGVATDIKGKYKIQAEPNDVLKFSFVGYKTKIVLVKNKNQIDVQLEPEKQNLEEVQVVSFGTQKKESVVSSIATVKADALRSSSSDLTSAFAGKIAGLIGWQTGGMPGALTEADMNTKFYIRGITSYQTGANIDPLILLDGVEISKLDLARIDPDDIESFNVMKDASATAMYGARGANGVIYVSTKKGKNGNVYASFRYERICSKPTDKIDIVNPIDYMKYYNEALIGRNPDLSPKYSAEKINRTASGKYPEWVYPATDWHEKLFKDQVINDHYSLNVRGGTSRMQYYGSVVFNDDRGMLKTDKLNQFNCNIRNQMSAIRLNLNVNLTNTAKLNINSFSTLDDYTGPYSDVRAAYYYAFYSSPVDYAPTYPDDGEHSWPHIRFGKNKAGSNPYARIQRGYTNKKRFSTVNQFEYIQNLASLCKGLEVRVSAALSRESYFTSQYFNYPAYYELDYYNHKTGEFSLNALNKDEATTMLVKSSVADKQSSTKNEYQVKLMHSAAWGNHQTSFTGVFQTQEVNNSAPKDMIHSLPHRNMGLSCRGTYGYKDRYFLEASFGYNGSERFADEHKMGFFPALGAAWVVTKNNFMRSASSWLNFLKFRASWGKVGNDGIINDPRFVYLETIGETNNGCGTTNRRESTSYFQILNYSNTNITWEIAEQVNLGLEAKLFNNLMSFNLDVYQEIRHNICDYRYTIPETMGLVLEPLDNCGEVRSRGIDFSGQIQHAFNNDFWMILNSTFTYNKSEYLNTEEPSNKKTWQIKKGREISQQIGYIAEGVFQDQNEIDNAPFQAGDIQPGDIRYRDIDGNGLIDINDAVPIGYPQTPRIIYGFGAFVHYKNFEFNIGFQGSGNRSFWINPTAVSPFVNNRSMLKAIADDHWSPTNNKTMPFWPKLSTQPISFHNPQEDFYTGTEVRKSTYFMRNGKFLRCTNIELACYLNKSFLNKFKLKNCKFYTRVNNPFIISDFDLWDVELGGNGFNYPIQKTYAIGVNFNF